MKNSFKLAFIIIFLQNFQYTFGQSEGLKKSIQYTSKELQANEQIKSKYDSIKIVTLNESDPLVTAPQVVREMFNRQTLSHNFFNLTQELAEASTISFVGLDYHYNLNRDLQKKQFLLNADIQIPIGLGGYRWFFKYKEEYIFHAFHIIPQFKVRIFKDFEKMKDTSNAVRTPSYMPRITYYVSSSGLLTEKKKDFFGVSVFHHSDGQDGNEYFSNNDNRYPFWRTGNVNTYNGNFGEQLAFELSWVHERQLKLRPIYGVINSKLNRLYKNDFFNKHPGYNIFGKKKSPKLMSVDATKIENRIFHRLSYEVHPKNVFGKVLTNEAFLKYNLYGRNRINFQFGYSYIPQFRDLIYDTKKEVWHEASSAKPKELLRFTMNLNFIADPVYNSGNSISQERIKYLDLSKRLNAYASGYLRFSGTSSSAFFIQAGYFGSDNYNIYFQESLWTLRAGISLLYFKYPKSDRKAIK